MKRRFSTNIDIGHRGEGMECAWGGIKKILKILVLVDTATSPSFSFPATAHINSSHKKALSKVELIIFRLTHEVWRLVLNSEAVVKNYD